MRLSKNFKLITVAVLCFVMVFATCISASAEVRYTTKTEYTGTSSDSKVTVTATATNVAQNDYLTYVAHTGDEISTGSIVYLDQEKSDSTNNGTITFEYSTNVGNLNQTKLFGGTDGGAGKYPVEDDPEDITDYYATTVKIVTTGSETAKEYKFYPYAEGVTPYNVARVFSIAPLYGGSGKVSKITISENEDGSNGTEISNYIINSDYEVTMYTDAIDKTGLYIIVNMVESSEISQPVLGGIEADSCTIQAKVHYQTGDEYGILVTQASSFDGLTLVNVTELGDDWSLDASTVVAFPALGLNEDGVFAVELKNLAAGTYRFAAYQGTAVEMSAKSPRKDIDDLNGQAVTYTVEAAQ